MKSKQTNNNNAYFTVQSIKFNNKNGKKFWKILDWKIKNKTKNCNRNKEFLKYLHNKVNNRDKNQTTKI